jgi:hypothetical protein
MVRLLKEVTGQWHVRLGPGGVAHALDFGLAPEIEVCVDAVFFGLGVFHQGQRRTLCDLAYFRLSAGSIRQNDLEED